MVKKYLDNFQKEFRNQTTTAILTAFAFIIALAWRDFISDSINQITTTLGVSEKFYLYKFLIAITITIIAILGIMIVTKLKINQEAKNN